MKIIEPSFRWLDGKLPDGHAILKNIATAGRVCYQSEPTTSDALFVMKIIERGHESVLEHEKLSVRIICDRGVSHELVRHRIASYSQESTRYCNYSKDKFGNELTFIRPPWVPEGFGGNQAAQGWKQAMLYAELYYRDLLEWGWTPEQARTVLPNSLKTEVVMTANLREWRHFFRLRCAPAAHPQMGQIAGMMLTEFKNAVPVIFDDLEV